MRRPLCVSILFTLSLMSSASGDCVQVSRPIPPGVREADKQTNAPVEPPATFKQKAVDPGLLRQEAEELAKLSAGIPQG